MKTISMLLVAVALCVTSAAVAQVTQTQPPSGSAPAAAPAGGMDKKAVSKQCSAMADGQNLHGKARKTFRSKCKMNGGKAA